MNYSGFVIVYTDKDNAQSFYHETKDMDWSLETEVTKAFLFETKAEAEDVLAETRIKGKVIHLSYVISNVKLEDIE